MIHLHTMGRIDLRGSDGREVDPVLVQPKRLALLAYLTLAGQGRFRRRDTIVSMFWCQSDGERARGALRQALRFLRSELGSPLLLTRGDDEIGVDVALLQCDALELDAAADQSAWGRVLDLYRGEFLAGLFVTDASAEFDRWLADERNRFKRRAVEAAWALVAAAEQRGDPVAATPLARRAMELVPDDETGVRRLMRILDRRGDRVGALHVYQEFRQRLAADYDATPAPETEALISAIRSREVQVWESPLSGWPDSRPP